jgi:hypothetical protein
VQQPSLGAPIVLQQAPGSEALPLIVIQQVVQPPGPLPPSLPAIVPPLKGDPQGDFEHILEFILGLDTQAKWVRIIVNAETL